MSSAHHVGATPWLSRRNLLLGAATIGVGGAVVSMASLSEAGEEGADSTEALVVHVRDAKSGTLDLFAGDRLVTVRNRDLAAELVKAAKKGKR